MTTDPKASEYDDDIETFEAEEPEENARPFRLVAIDKREAKGSAKRKVAAIFEARPDMSFGQLLVEMTEDKSGESTLRFYERALVDDNSHPDGEDDDRTEFERFRDFIGDENLLVTDTQLRQLAERLSAGNAERPTLRQGGSRGTRRANGQRGSTARRPRRT